MRCVKPHETCSEGSGSAHDDGPGETADMSENQLFPPEPEPDPTMSVRELANRFSTMIRREFNTEIWVSGQIRNLNRSARGHVYFNLVEPPAPGEAPNASVSVVLFDSTRQIINRRLSRTGAGRMEDGVEIRIRAAVDYYVPQGSLQIRMTSIDPEYTLGRLAADRDHILRTLDAEGLLQANSRLAFPLAPQRVALITSAASAASADFQDELTRSGLRFDIRMFDTRVQGEGAVESLQRALGVASESDADLIVLIRGGGSRTDLAAFDSEIVARAIAASQIPVLVGVGHEIDRSIADEVAHTSLKTPTACGNHLVQQLRGVDDRFAELGERIAALARSRPPQVHFGLHLIARRVIAASDAAIERSTRHTNRLAQAVRQEANTGQQRAQDRLVSASARLVPAGRSTLRQASSTMDRAASRLSTAAPRALRNEELNLRALAAQVRAVDPAHAIARGFSITTDHDGRIVRSVQDLPDTFVTRLIDGTVESTVDKSTVDQSTVTALSQTEPAIDPGDTE